MPAFIPPSLSVEDVADLLDREKLTSMTTPRRHHARAFESTGVFNISSASFTKAGTKHSEETPKVSSVIVDQVRDSVKVRGDFVSLCASFVTAFTLCLSLLCLCLCLKFEYSLLKFSMLKFLLHLLFPFM